MASNYFGVTDTGKLRDNNEDAFIAEPVMGGRYVAACVIDGVGGYHGGEVAARIAQDEILAGLNHQHDDVIATMKRAFFSSNEKIQRERNSVKDNEQMACVVTLAVADINQNKFYYAHVGDTRLYLLRDQTLVKITRDHSFVGFLEDNGRLSEDAAMNHPKRNEINKALGFDSGMNMDEYVETGDSPFLPGDVLLLCSDGLSDMVTNKGMTDILNSNKTLAEKAKLLVKAANDAGGKDNITVVLVENNKTPIIQEAMKPSVNIKKQEELNEEVSFGTNVQAPEIAVKKRSSAVPVLTVLCLILLGAFLYLLYQGSRNKKVYQEQSANIVVKKDRTPGELALMDSIAAGRNNEVFILNPPDAAAMVITDSILINNDSLHILGNGATLIADSSFRGPLFTLAASCRYILVDSLTIENFDIGFLSKTPGLHFKNVQFRNVGVPVQQQIGFKDGTPVSGSISAAPVVIDSTIK